MEVKSPQNKTESTGTRREMTKNARPRITDSKRARHANWETGQNMKLESWDEVEVSQKEIETKRLNEIDGLPSAKRDSNEILRDVSVQSQPWFLICGSGRRSCTWRDLDVGRNNS
jgi:hypothetical protein